MPRLSQVDVHMQGPLGESARSQHMRSVTSEMLTRRLCGKTELGSGESPQGRR